MFFIYFLLSALIITSITPRKIVRQCEYSFLDEDCPHQLLGFRHQCLPNAITLASGVDITDDTIKSTVLGLRWGNDCFYNQYNQKCYIIPDGVTVIPLSESDDITGTFIMHNTTETERVQSDAVVDKSDYIVGMSSHTVDTYQSITSQYQQSSQIGYVIYYYGFYSVLTPYNEQTLDPDTYKVIMKLPEEYDQTAYFEFIGSYGTHFITSSKWGIKYKFMSSFKECMVNTESESYVYTQVQTDGWIHSSEHTTYSGSSKTDSYYESRKYTSESFDGGNISYHTSAMWDKWVDSGANLIDPVIIAMNLSPIFQIINDTIRQDNMKRAYYEYLQMKKDQQTLIIQQKKLGPRSVAMASFDIFQQSIIPQIKYGPTSIQLSANETSFVFGKTGKCNRMTKYAYELGGYYEGEVCLPPVDFCFEYYCLTEFQCQRNEEGDIRAQRYFDKEGWLSSVRTRGDPCIDSYLFQNMSDVGVSNLFDYQKSGSDYYGSESPKGYTDKYNVNSYQMFYKMDYAKTSQTTAFDGEYVKNGMSITSFKNAQPSCGGFGVCYVDCDYLTIGVDPNGYPSVECSC